MSSLFKEVAPDGTATYSDTERVCGININTPNAAFQQWLYDPARG